MICSECGEQLYVNKASIIEWLSTEDGLALADTIRIVHSDCEYSKSRDLLSENHFDHWLPLQHIPMFLEIALEMDWDDAVIAISSFNDYINQVQQTNKEVRK